MALGGLIFLSKQTCIDQVCAMSFALCETNMLTGPQRKASTFQPTPSKTKPKQKASAKWPKEQAIRWSVCRITLSGTSIPKRRRATWARGRRISASCIPDLSRAYFSHSISCCYHTLTSTPFVATDLSSTQFEYLFRLNDGRSLTF